MSAHWGRDTLCFKTKGRAGGWPAVAAGVLQEGGRLRGKVGEPVSAEAEAPGGGGGKKPLPQAGSQGVRSSAR